MKKIYLQCAFLLAMTTVFAMDSLDVSVLSDEDRAEVKNRMLQIRFVFDQGPVYFARPGDESGRESAHACLDNQMEVIKRIFAKNSIACPNDLSLQWIQDLEKKLASKSQPANYTCDISGLDKADVLQALYEAAQSNPGRPTLPTKFVRKDFEAALTKNRYDIDYFGNRPLKVYLGDDTFNTVLYNRGNGAGAAQRVIAALRARARLQQTSAT